MHPCDAKGSFFSEVEVLRVAQSRSPCAGAFHVIFDGVVVGACGGAAWVAVLCPQNAYFCFSMSIRFVALFCSIYSHSSFHIHFYHCFFMPPLAAYSIAPRGLDV